VITLRGVVNLLLCTSEPKVSLSKETLVATMVKWKSNKSDLKVPTPFIAEKDNDEDPKEKSVAVKLTTNLAGEAPPIPTPELQTIFNQVTIEHYFKWISSLHNIMSNHTIREKYAVALKTLKGSDRDPWLAQCNTDGPALADQQTTEA
jgi:hypothetical protein